MDLAGVPCERHRVVGREPRRRPDPDDAAEGGGDADRAAEIGALGERQHAGRDRNRGAARRARRAERAIPGIAGGAEHRIDGVGAGRKFRRIGLGKQDGAGRLEATHHLGVLVGNEIFEQWRPEGGSDAGGVRHVLDAEGQAVKRPERLAVHDRGLGPPRRGSRGLRGEGHDRIELGVDPRDRREMGVEHLDRADRA